MVVFLEAGLLHEILAGHEASLLVTEAYLSYQIIKGSANIVRTPFIHFEWLFIYNSYWHQSLNEELPSLLASVLALAI